MSEVLRFGVSIESDLLESFDQLVARQGYATRSESLRDLIRDALVRSRLEGQDAAGEVLGTLTLVYDHHAHELMDQMAELQHQHHGLVVSVLHVHINHDDCMEVIVLRGRTGEVRTLADGLLSLKGVKHGKLFVTLAARHITEHTASRRAHTHAHAAAPPTRLRRKAAGQSGRPKK
ncbi:nickel-responsive transcriptional regulator NikR [soil metagenome]